jgi:uncharacterized metal-binding protein
LAVKQRAHFLQKAGTELNVMLGLCVGHDSLFSAHSHAPVTVLAVKDRILGHNPLAASYLVDGYYYDKLFPSDTKVTSDSRRQLSVDAFRRQR